MLKTIALFVKKCDICTKVKPTNRRPEGMLQTPTIPAQRWSNLTMDFITGFTPSRGFDSIFVVVDRLTKRAVFVPHKKTDDAEAVANLFMDYVVRDHGLPMSIISDRDPLFISHMWKTLTKMLGVSQDLSTSGHPETDGQTERLNRVLVQLMRTLAASHATEWAKYLGMAQFAYNSQYQLAIRTTPFFADLGYHPRYWQIIHDIPLATAIGDDSMIGGYEFVHRQERILESIQVQLADTQKETTAKVNRKRSDVEYKEGEYVLLHRHAFRTARTSKQKFLPPFQGPYKIVKVLNNTAFQIQVSSRKIITANIQWVRKYHAIHMILPEVESDPWYKENISEIQMIVDLEKDYALVMYPGKADPVPVPETWIRLIPHEKRITLLDELDDFLANNNDRDDSFSEGE